MASNLKNLPEIVFADADAGKVESSILSEYESLTGRSLAKGDPVRLFLLTIAAVIILLLNKINETGKQNLLRYATGDNLDHLGALVGVERIPATAAVTTMRITLSAALGTVTVIPGGTRFTAGDNVFFALAAPIIIAAGELSGEGKAICLDTGTKGNGYIAGQLKTLVDPVPYVDSVTNITTSEGGAELEDDESYREAIHTAPEKYSVAGPQGAYEYFAKRASASIIDVSVWSPAPGTVEVLALIDGGEAPGQELLEQLTEALNDKSVRPLTDKVVVKAPDYVDYDLDISFFIDRSDAAEATQIIEQVNTAVAVFMAWQQGRIGRDINPSRLIADMMAAGAKRVELKAPAFKVLSQTEAARLRAKNVIYGGLEDG